MLKKINYLVAVLSLMLVPALSLGYASADTAQNSVCKGIGLASNDNGCTEDGSSPTVNSTIHAVVTILSFIVGTASVIMIMVGGFRYVTSGGDSTKVGSAKNTLLYALVGLIIVALAQVIVRFTLNRTSGNHPSATPGCTTEQRRNDEC